jgi:predicted amidohydrolase YtcJ
MKVDGQSSVVEALAVRDGKILATGSNASITLLVGRRTRVLDLASKTVIPGLIDTHAHFKAAGLSDYVVNMSRAKTVAEALDAIKTFVAKKKPGEWIVGGAWQRRLFWAGEPWRAQPRYAPSASPVASKRAVNDEPRYGLYTLVYWPSIFSSDPIPPMLSFWR